MRTIKLSGREASVVRAIGFANSMLGAEIQDYVRMESDDVTDILNSLMAAGFVESIPYSEQIELAEMPVMSFEVNPAYSHESRVVSVTFARGTLICTEIGVCSITSPNREKSQGGFALKVRLTTL